MPPSTLKTKTYSLCRTCLLSVCSPSNRLSCGLHVFPLSSADMKPTHNSRTVFVHVYAMDDETRLGYNMPRRLSLLPFSPVESFNFCKNSRNKSLFPESLSPKLPPLQMRNSHVKNETDQMCCMIMSFMLKYCVFFFSVSLQTQSFVEVIMIKMVVLICNFIIYYFFHLRVKVRTGLCLTSQRTTVLALPQLNIVMQVFDILMQSSVIIWKAKITNMEPNDVFQDVDLMEWWETVERKLKMKWVFFFRFFF